MTGWLHVCSCGNPAKYVVIFKTKTKTNRVEVCGIHLANGVNKWVKVGRVTVDTIQRAHGDG